MSQLHGYRPCKESLEMNDVAVCVDFAEILCVLTPSWCTKLVLQSKLDDGPWSEDVVSSKRAVCHSKLFWKLPWEEWERRRVGSHQGLSWLGHEGAASSPAGCQSLIWLSYDIRTHYTAVRNCNAKVYIHPKRRNPGWARFGTRKNLSYSKCTKDTLGIWWGFPAFVSLPLCRVTTLDKIQSHIHILVSSVYNKLLQFLMLCSVSWRVRWWLGPFRGGTCGEWN